jgi:hypothetical protein
MSDFLPTIIGEEDMKDIDYESVDGNLSTLVHRFIFSSGQTLMSTGDTSKLNVDEMCARYGSYLKSDIMTVPHHGANVDSYRGRNGTIEFYQLVDPAVVMWPAVESRVASSLQWNGKAGAKNEANYYLFNKMNVKENIIAGGKTTTITIPYIAEK